MEKMKIIGLLGKSKSGKDTAGRMLMELGTGGQTMAFADKLKSIAGEMFHLSHDDMYVEENKAKPTKFDCLMCPECRSVEVVRMTLDKENHGQCKVCGVIGDVKVFASKWTPRTILQYLGTEGFRRIDPGVWVNYLIHEANNRFKGQSTQVPKAEFIAVTDCRFLSECEGIWAVGGDVWRIRRPETDGTSTGLKGHQSETELDTIPDSRCQAVIHNDASLDVFRGRLHTELTRFLR